MKKYPDHYLLTLALGSKAAPGYREDSLVIETGVPAWPREVLPVRGEIGDVVVAKPLVVNLGAVARGEIAGSSFLLLSAREGLEIMSLRADPGFLELRAEKEDGRRQRVHVKAAGGRPEGPLQGKVRVEANAGRRVEIEVPVVGRFVD